MLNSIAQHVRNRITATDWSLLGGSVLISVGMGIARALGFAFSLVLAQAFTPGDYGKVQYAIAVAGVVAIATQPFVQHVLARFIGRHQNDMLALRQVITNAWGVLLVLVVATLVVAIPVLLALQRFNIGIILIFLGTTLFYSYWGVASGFLSPGRLTTAYLGSNVVQIVLTLLLIQVLAIRSPLLAMAIYGLSYLLPILTLQIVKPFPVRFQPALLDIAQIRRLVRFSVPIWLSHAAYSLYVAVDIILLEHFTDDATVGVYSLARTVALIFSFIPAGISTILMPKIASLPVEKHGHLLRNMLALSLLANVALLAVYLLFGEWFIRTTVGPAYLGDRRVLLILAAETILSGIQSLITAVLVGSNRARIDMASRVATLAVAALACWYLIPLFGAVGAASAKLAGVIGAFIAYAILLLPRPRVLRQSR